MKLKYLNIKIQNAEEFIKSINTSLKSNKISNNIDYKTIKFDSERTFHNVFTLNKLQILRAISHTSPESIYGLATYLRREPQHVLKDCRLLESLKFIKLEKVNSGGRVAVKPSLVFDYDVIKLYIGALAQPLPVSVKAENLLRGSSQKNL